MKTILFLGLLGFLVSCSSLEKCEEKESCPKHEGHRMHRDFSPADRLR